jgi:hypothetical protein
MQPVLFIDANQYLKLFGIVSGKKLLDLIDAHRKYIFVPKQTTDEVLRNKLRLAGIFFREQVDKFKKASVSIPDHLLGVGENKLSEFRELLKQVQNAGRELGEIASDTLTRMGRSEDEVSKRLEPLFDTALAPNENEKRAAQYRKERGNPPGKPSDPLGDQICWEQMLSRVRQLGAKSIWLITEDQDYFVKSGEEPILNPFLYRDLIEACGGQPDVHCFDDLLRGRTEFAKSVGAQDAALPTKDEAKEIQKEIDYWNANTFVNVADRDQMLRNFRIDPAFAEKLGEIFGTKKKE